MPSSTGAQNKIRYAYFPATRRLAIEIKGHVTIYDTLDHQISGYHSNKVQVPHSPLLANSA